jgi:ABC-type sugar transport system permease subunit
MAILLPLLLDPITRRIIINDHNFEWSHVRNQVGIGKFCQYIAHRASYIMLIIVSTIIIATSVHLTQLYPCPVLFASVLWPHFLNELFRMLFTFGFVPLPIAYALLWHFGTEDHSDASSATLLPNADVDPSSLSPLNSDSLASTAATTSGGYISPSLHDVKPSVGMNSSADIDTNSDAI